jgi:hypothetical protein
MGNKPADLTDPTEWGGGDPFKIPEPDPLLFKLLTEHPYRRYESLQIKKHDRVNTEPKQELPE